MMLNEDYKEILQCLADEEVSFLLVGAYAMAAHGFPRATMDILKGIETYVIKNNIDKLSDLVGTLET